MELSISPFDEGLHIRWHNLPAIERAGGIYIHLNFTSNATSSKLIEESVAIEDITDNNNIYELDGLVNGIAYRLVEVRVELPGNIFRVIDNIVWSEPWETKTNAQDQEGNGTVVGANHDEDGRANSVDADDDNDGRPDNMDHCRLGEIGWSSTDSTSDDDGDGCRDRDEDVDDDGDGLIEIHNAAELDAVRHVLAGTGFKMNATVMLEQTGCGDGMDVMICNGYELVRDISLVDYITDNYATVGWQPIASDVDNGNTDCDGGSFTAMFDGNGFEVRGLWINRSTEDCIGLFGQVRGSIRDLGVVADEIEGRRYVGGLVGWGENADITQSYSVTGEVSGSGHYVGGLVGWGENANITQSYTVTGEVSGSGDVVGGLVGNSGGAEIVQSYTVTGEVSGNSNVGGLLGSGGFASIVQSYSVTGEVSGSVSGNSNVGGLLGFGEDASIVQSYSVSGSVSGNSNVGGLVGNGDFASIDHSYTVTGEVSGNNNVGGLVGFGMTTTNSYWDTETSGRTNDSATGSRGNTTMALRSPRDYTGIYATWDDGAISEGTTIAGIDHNGTKWCDEDASYVIEGRERRGAGDTNGDNRVWDFGTDTDYPAIRCTLDSPADQRAWWYLNATHKPQLNQSRLDAWLGGSLLR